MTQHEILSDILAQIPPVKRPARVTDRELAATYLSVRKTIAAMKRGDERHDQGLE